MNSPAFVYQERIRAFTSGIDQLRKPLRWIPWLRVFLFIFTGFSIFYAIKFTGAAFVALPVMVFAGFLVAGWYDSKLKKGIRKFQHLIRINEEELKALDGNFSAFGAGTEFINQDHPYTHDLDIFGERSLFQFVNRTSTIFGSKRLADYFNNAFQYRLAIRNRQKAVKELAGVVEFRQNLQLIFHDHQTSESDLQALTSWLQQPGGMSGVMKMKLLFFIIPVLTLLMIVLSVAGAVPYQIPVFLVMLQLFIVFGFGRKTLLAHQAVTSQVKILRRYSDALDLIEKTIFKSEHLRKLQSDVQSGENGQPSEIIRKLSGLLNLMDSNLNMLVSVILNGLFMFNIHVLMETERWRVRYRALVPQWFTVIAEMDALSSLGTNAFNYPENCFPEPVSDDFEFSATLLGHPLIPESACVRNDIEIAGWNQFRIITGANMSGKSTFLRTIGVNYLLAMMGAPVCATQMRFTPIEIHSSIRTNDSLARRESYFYAELRRLKEIIDELKSGRRMLILLDEILKGTNSSDKQSGSIALIRQLLKYQLVGLFATHDLALGTLINEFPENIENLCFEISISGDRMEITYQLTPGVCKNLNASFLMKNMGIILENDPHS